MREQYREEMFNDSDLMERSDASAALRLHSVLHQEECAQRALEEEQQQQSTEEAQYPPARKKLKRELDAEALARLEDAARTVSDFENIVAVWDRLDANRERRERYHEISRSGDVLPIDYGAAENGVSFPSTPSSMLEHQLRKGEMLEIIFNCPLEIHQLVTEEYLSAILLELSDENKLLLFLLAVRLLSAAAVAARYQQSDRNIRKVRATLMKRIRKKLLPALREKARKQPMAMTAQERNYLTQNDALLSEGGKCYGESV